MKLPPLLRDPLLHFVAIGVVLFLSTLAVGKGVDRGHQIEITAAKQAQMATLFRATWGRPPSPVEFEGLVQAQVRDEVYYREAVALGLDRDDIVVRQRMRQKLEFLQGDQDPPAAPSDADLRGFYARHRANYGEDLRYSFRQVAAPGPTADRAFLARVRASPDPAALSGLKLLPYAMKDASLTAVKGTFGEEFANALGGLTPGGWTGPVPSAFGVHMVALDARAPARIRRFEEVRAQVRSDYLEARDAARTEAAYRALRARYRIVVAPRPRPAAGS